MGFYLNKFITYFQCINFIMNQLIKMLAAIVILSLIFNSSNAAPSAPGGDFNKIDKWSKMKVYWKIEEDQLIIEMQGQTMGWVGIYFSKYGRGMKDADSTVGSVVPDKAYVMDLYFKNTYNRNPDKRQDVKIISGSEEDGWTTIRFSKNIHTTPCPSFSSSNQDCLDQDLLQGEVNLCAAIGGDRDDMSENGRQYGYHKWKSSYDCVKVDFLKEWEEKQSENESLTTEEEVTTVKPTTTLKPTTTKKPTTTIKPVTEACKDNYNYCTTWAKKGYCSNSWVGEHCKLSCEDC